MIANFHIPVEAFFDSGLNEIDEDSVFIYLTEILEVPEEVIKTIDFTQNDLILTASFDQSFLHSDWYYNLYTIGA